MKKFLSLILAICMVLPTLGTSVLASGEIIITDGATVIPGAIMVGGSSASLDVNISDIIGGKIVTFTATVSSGNNPYITPVLYYSLDGSDPLEGTRVGSVIGDKLEKEIELTEASTVQLRAIAATSSGGAYSDEYTKTITVNQVSKPAISSSGNTVTIKSSTSGASIYYTLDGSTPTTDSTLYTSAITLSKTATVKAIAVKSGYANSQVAASSITYSAPTPSPAVNSMSETEAENETEFELDDQLIYYDSGSVKVVLFASDNSAAIYYTLDGSDADTLSKKYTGPFYLYEDTELSAIAVLDGETAYLWDSIAMEEFNEYEEDYEAEEDYETGEDYGEDEEYYEDDENYDDYEESYGDEDYEDEYSNGDDAYEGNLISSDWAEDEIDEALESGLIPDIMTGEDLTKVITREKFAAIAVYLYQSLSGDYIDFDDADISYTPFTDCYYRESDYIDYISIAYDLGLIAGISRTEFAPDSAISRQDLCVMLGRVVKKCMYDGWTIEKDSRYSFDTSGAQLFDDDGDISDYAKESVYFMAKNGIVLGVDDTHFAPQNITDWQKANGYATSTKEQAIAISLRCCNKFLNLSD